MKRDVVVKVIGQQEAMNPNSEEIEVFTTGKYYYKKGRHILIFDEIMDEDMGVTHNMIKIDEAKSTVIVDKKGVITSRMEFKLGEKSMTFYSTPLGGFTMETITEDIAFGFQGERMVLEIRYKLEMNYEQVSENRIHIETWSAPQEV